MTGAPAFGDRRARPGARPPPVRRRVGVGGDGPRRRVVRAAIVSSSSPRPSAPRVEGPTVIGDRIATETGDARRTMGLPDPIGRPAPRAADGADSAGTLPTDSLPIPRAAM